VKSTAKPAPPIETYYDLLALKPRATAREVEIAFRRWVARYRPATASGQLFTDPRFMKYLNAYLTLRGDIRAKHDTLISQPPAKGKTVVLPTPWASLDERQRTLLTARIALWRRENLDGIHLLRSTLEKEPDFADGWALLGEFFLTLDRLEEGIRAYEHAVQTAPQNGVFAARLQHARDALAGTVELQIEQSPEEDLLREERRRRRAVASAIIGLGLVTLAASFKLKIHLVESTLYVPWRVILTQSLGIFVLFLGLSFGRLLQPFERVLLWSSLRAGDRGTLRNYPYGLILLVTAVPSMWLAFASLLVMAFMDEEWPWSPSIMLGVCAVVNLLLSFAVCQFSGHAHWAGTLLIGGNALVLTAMLGWWLGSLGGSSYN